MSAHATAADVLRADARWCVVEGDAADVLRDARDDLTACDRLLAMTEETAWERDAELTAEVVRLRAAATTGGEGR